MGVDMTPALLCMALALHFEARGEPLLGQYAVAEVIVARSQVSGRSVCEVVFSPHQFEGLSHFHDGMPVPKFSRATLRAANHAFNDELRVCRGCRWFHKVQPGRPAWTAGLSPAKTIGRHVFYRA